MHRQLGGVDDMVGDLAQVPQSLALAVNSIGNGSIACQRMPPARFRKPTNQRFVARIEKEHVHLMACAANLIQRARNLLEEKLLPRINHQSQPGRLLAQTHQLRELRKKQYGEVVDAKESEVLQRTDGDGFA